MTTHSFGWRPDAPDPRDARYAFALPGVEAAPTPDTAFLSGLPPITNQGRYNSCTAHACTAAFWYVMIRQKGAVFAPSRAFDYWYGRVLDIATFGGRMEDAGLTIRNGMKALAQYGDCPEPSWPYTSGNIRKEPSRQARAAAIKHQALVYRSVPIDLAQIDAAIAAGYPVALGSTWYENQLTEAVDRTGRVPMPEGRPVGGHATALVGFDRPAGWYVLRNSWGLWGNEGYGTFPREYIRQFSGDAWTLQAVL